MDDAPHPHAGRTAGQAYLVDPPGGPGPGVLVLHSWRGLDDWTRSFSRRLAAEGYTVLAPDLLEGSSGQDALLERDADELSGLVISSAHALRANTVDETRPIAVVGLSMGASMALWLSARLPQSVDRVAVFYGAQAIDFDQAEARFQGHFGSNDEHVSEEDRVTTESFIRLGGNHTEFHVYDDAEHWFFEDGPTHDPAAAELAWERLVAFLAADAEPDEG